MAAAFAVDAFGAPQPVELHAGQLQIAVSVTPIFISLSQPMTRLPSSDALS